MKAYIVFPGDSPYDGGCILVYAPNRNAAKNHAWKTSTWSIDSYIDLTALRVKEYDKFYDASISTTSYHIETNEELPFKSPNFFDTEI